jgi:hypothetical protein
LERLFYVASKDAIAAIKVRNGSSNAQHVRLCVAKQPSLVQYKPNLAVRFGDASAVLGGKPSI